MQPEPRSRNDGLRKRCECPRRRWPKCAHAWHFNFKWNGETYRFSLSHHIGRIVRGAGGAWERDRATLGKPIADKTAAVAERDRLRNAIREGTLQAAPETERPLRETITLDLLAAAYLERYVQVERSSTIDDFRSGLHVICATSIPQPTGEPLRFGAWRVADIVTDTIERYREARRAAGAGLGGTNRSLSRLRALLNWGVKLGYLEATPFKRNTVTVVTLSREAPRTRRLDADRDEEAALLAACGPHLRAVVECALETGMRRGEILSLEWRQIEGMRIEESTVTWAPRAEIVLPWTKTKTRRDRRIPISARLKAMLEMRRFDPAGEPLALDRHVFGNELGEAVTTTKRAWLTAVLKAHGHRPAYTRTMNLTAETRELLDEIDLHFHDLRREAGSRWLEGGVPLHVVRDWLGHTNVSQTSTYLAGTLRTQHDAMAQYEARRNAPANGPTGSGSGEGANQDGATGETPEALETLCNGCATDSGTGGQIEHLGEMTASEIPNKSTRAH